MFYLMTHSTHFIYGYMVSDIWSRTTHIAREKTHCRHIGYSFQLAARVLLYPSEKERETLSYKMREERTHKEERKQYLGEKREKGER